MSDALVPLLSSILVSLLMTGCGSCQQEHAPIPLETGASTTNWTTAPGPLFPVARENSVWSVSADGRIFLVTAIDRERHVSRTFVYRTRTEDDSDDASGWSEASNLLQPRRGHSVAQLTGGRAIICGGIDSRRMLTASTEMLDTATGRWERAEPLPIAIAHTTLTTLADGRVLLTGGLAGSEAASFPDEEVRGNQAEPVPLTYIFDSQRASWSAAAPMNDARVGHSATLLTDGTVLVVGGEGGTTLADDMEAGFYFNSLVERYDPATNTWSTAGRIPEPRRDHSATRLEDGRVLIFGGLVEPVGVPTSSAVLFDPDSSVWIPLDHRGPRRWAHSATRLSDGRVLIAGGYDPRGDGVIDFTLSSSFLFDPRTSAFVLGPQLPRSRGGHGAVLLENGSVLLFGGYSHPWRDHDSTNDPFDQPRAPLGDVVLTIPDQGLEAPITP